MWRGSSPAPEPPPTAVALGTRLSAGPHERTRTAPRSAPAPSCEPQTEAGETAAREMPKPHASSNQTAALLTTAPQTATTHRTDRDTQTDDYYTHSINHSVFKRTGTLFIFLFKLTYMNKSKLMINYYYFCKTCFQYNLYASISINRLMCVIMVIVLLW